jgi:ABC-type sugar transport system ATPase subunit
VLFLDRQLNRKGRGVEGMTDRTAPALRLEGIVKTFPGVRALDGVSFRHAGRGSRPDGRERRRQIHLMKVLGGIYQPDEGKIFIAEQDRS